MKKLTLIFFLLSIIITEENNYYEYQWPSNASNTITAVFGDERSRRFHAGIDVRTYGIIGKEIYAIESGYVERIKITHNGYGKAIYLKLDDGNTALYAHLDKFNPILERKSLEIQKQKNSSFFDAFFKKNELRFNKGDIIGYSGDTGSLSGPHLHFEIRNKDGKPINPLKHCYSINDTINPIASAIAFVPLDNSCWINGVQDYAIFDLEKINEYKYVISDTISIVGNFGVLLETHDKVNKQPFNFGVYSIEMLVNNNPKYKIQFDEYFFENDPLIYNELDYYLSHNYSRKFHNLFINNNSNLDFINSNSNHGLNLNDEFHNLTINVSDINNNKIQIQSIIKGDILLNPKLSYNEQNQTLFSENGFKNLQLSFTTRYKDSKSIPASYTKTDSQFIKLNPAETPYDILKYYRTNSNGIKSKIDFLSFKKYDPYKINGEIKIKQIGDGIIIEFIESIYSGYDAKLEIILNDMKKISKKLYRKEKNVLSTDIINTDQFNGINSIKVIYQSYPEIVFNKKINSISVIKDEQSNLKHGNFNVSLNPNSTYKNLLIAIEDTMIKSNENYKLIENPIKIIPADIPFKEKVNLYYSLNNTKLKKGAIFNYNHSKDNWIFMENFRQEPTINENKEYIKTNIYSGGIFSVMNEDVKPMIKKIIPAKNAKYKSNDLMKVSFIVDDEHSGINHNSIVVKIDDTPYFYTYIPYRKTIECNLNKKLNTGKHTLEIYVEDNIFNSKSKKYIFYIE